MNLGNIISTIVNYLSSRKALFFTVLIAILGVLFMGISRLQVSQNIYSTLPKSKSFEQLNKLIENKSITNQVVFSLDVEHIQDEDSIRTVLNDFADSLNIVSKNYLTNIVSTRPDVEQTVYDYFYNNFPLLIDSTYYRHLDNKLQPDSIKSSVNASYHQLVGPGSAFTKQYILRDPLFLSSNFFLELNATNNSEGVVVEDGIVYTKDKKKILITAKTAFDTHNSVNNTKAYNTLEDFKARWNTLHPNNKITYFGTFQIAAQNAIQIKKDAVNTGLIALIIILTILIVYYRKIVIPIYFILPAMFGGLFASGIIGLIKPEISGISIACGSILFGIMLDFSFHFFTHLKHTRSISTTIKEISAPLLTGSFTTVIAFIALLFTNSAILQDFGLFGALSLTGAAFFTICFLPILLKIFRFDYSTIQEEERLLKIRLFSKKFRGVVMAIIILLTIVFLQHANNTEFDSQLENLSYHTSDLKDKEVELTGINPRNEKKIYVFAAGEMQTANENNYRVFEIVKQLKNTGKVKSFLSVAQFQIPESIKNEREIAWNNYWQNKKAGTINLLDKTADSLGFDTNAFEVFKNWIDHKEATLQSDSLVSALGLDNLIEHSGNKTTLITTVVVENKNLAQVKAELRKIKGAELLEMSEMATSLLDIVKKDFNYIFWVSSLVVFFTLLLIYGRIELALLAFLPMVVSWVWILGICALAGIKFNFVNIVIATFIFGLGDDFSIFVNDGLLNKYKYKKDAIASGNLAILLSALTTLIGTGVLFFAKHPAIHGIALISVLGIAVILIISLLFQPFIFNYFVQRRIEKKRAPITFFPFLISCFDFAYFVCGCVLMYLLFALLLLMPLPRAFKRKTLNTLMSLFAGSVMYAGVHVHKRFFNKENLDIKNPSIIIANHSSFLDILLVMMLHPKIIIMVKEWVYRSPLFGPFVRYVGYIYSETGAESNLDIVRERIAAGYSIAVFPEGTRSPDGKLLRFHKGAFYLAQELNLDITPVLLHGISDVLPKNDFYVHKGSTHLKILPRIKANDTSWGNTYSERTKSISKYFKAQHKIFKEERETAAYLWNKVYHNYIFKGPVLEWYLRIKWKLESKNYESYNEQIADRINILDIGCGYGFLPLYLHYKNENRNIVGVDYDEDKIAIAQNVYDKNENLNFEHADINLYEIKNQDVIFLNDVLHYLSEEKQLLVLNKCLAGLNPNGIVFIRDGIADLKNRHKNTKKTEQLSTKIFRFNKKEEDFHFFSSDFIKSFAVNNNLDLEMTEHSKKTSNVLFILKKS